jgi:archaeosortase B (VPXXXP-CTERM-specific)
MASKRRRGQAGRPATGSARAAARSAAGARRRLRPPGPLSSYLLLFLALAGGLFLLYRWSESTDSFTRVNALNASLCSTLLRAAGIPNTCTGTSLQFDTCGFDVISECSAIYVAILYAAAVLAFPARWRLRLLGCLAGVALIFALNVLRLASLGVVLRYRPEWLSLFHEYLWQVLFILIVAGIYVAWLERFVHRARTRPAA